VLIKTAQATLTSSLQQFKDVRSSEIDRSIFKSRVCVGFQLSLKIPHPLQRFPRGHPSLATPLPTPSQDGWCFCSNASAFMQLATLNSNLRASCNLKNYRSVCALWGLM